MKCQELMAENTLRQILQNKDIVGTLNDPISITISQFHVMTIWNYKIQLKVK
jgi:hypothetical protein